jgi:hypothetical protein
MKEDSYYVCYNKKCDYYFLDRHTFIHNAILAHQFYSYKKAEAKIKKFYDSQDWVVQKVLLKYTVEEVTE